ncbi:Protein TolB [Flagellimonas maritima]|uniref:Protein TolB n=1 Tax=Flagellimonas maritima TaxID=1383885 RepID=A0A2Z4LV34_9FLAO|nr:DPP IV N-terminal domain-containing protein [Allomuricauda aurantiaca]AWX45751.1 Protein TolB [Allomuricauda aurantiaca]
MKKTIILLQLILLSGFTKSFGQLGKDLNQPKKITNIKNAYPFPTRDGKNLVFHSNRLGNNDIYIKNLETGKLKQLTKNEANDRTPSISPDGKHIAFVSTRDGNYDVFIMDLDGSNQTNLTQDSLSKDIHPYWSPDGKQIIYNSTMKGQNYNIYTMKINGTDRVKIRKNNGEATHAQYSPDGSKIAFRRFFGEGENSNSEIVIMDIGSGKEQRIAKSLGFDNHPTWSKNGHKVFFTSNRDGENKYDVSIYEYSLLDKKIRRLTFHPSSQEDMTPIYNPHGNSIFYSRWLRKDSIDIFELSLFSQ